MMEKKKKKNNDYRLFYSMAAGVMAVAVAAAGALYLDQNRHGSTESPYLVLDEEAEPVVVADTAADLSDVAEGKTNSENEESNSAAVNANSKMAEAEDSQTEKEEGTPSSASEEENTMTMTVPLGEDTVANAIPRKEDSLSFGVNETLTWPVEGEILREFSMDTTVYYPTLNAYKVSPALVIQSEAGEPVKASADGVVKETGWNEELGNYLVLTLGDGYELTYGQLADPVVKTGDEVASNDVIATVAEPTMYYSVEGDNIYLGLTKDGEAVDPLDYMD